MMRRTLTLMAFLLPATAIAAMTGGTDVLLGLLSDHQQHGDSGVRTRDAAGGLRVLVVQNAAGPAVWTPQTSYDEEDLGWCAQNRDGSLTSCDSWGNIATPPWEGSTGCIYGICWCTGGCTDWLYTCPTAYYDLVCSEGNETCFCTEK
jgi:hypothetical protein